MRERPIQPDIEYYEEPLPHVLMETMFSSSGEDLEKSKVVTEEFNEWLKKNMKGLYVPGMIAIMFEDEEDAFLYKMKWL